MNCVPSSHFSRMNVNSKMMTSKSNLIVLTTFDLKSNFFKDFRTWDD